MNALEKIFTRGQNVPVSRLVNVAARWPLRYICRSEREEAQDSRYEDVLPPLFSGISSSYGLLQRAMAEVRKGAKPMPNFLLFDLRGGF
jgi:hypothetical protein